MPISPSDILWKLSAASSAVGDSMMSSGPGTNLGKYMSSDTITDNVIDNVFTDLTGSQNATSQVDYQCIFIHNSNATLTLFNTVVWITNEVAGGANIALANDNMGATIHNSTTAQATQISFHTTTPVGIGPFSSPTTQPAAISLGSIGPQQCAALWIRRTATNSGPLNLDGITLMVHGDTPS